MKLTSHDHDCKAALLLGNCLMHLDTEKFVSDDGKNFVKFLPHNVTYLIPLVDQAVLESLKQRYKKKLLHKLVIRDKCGITVAVFFKCGNEGSN